MDDQTNQDNSFVSTMSDFADMLIANILWILSSLPIITLGASCAALYSVMRSPGDKRYTTSIVANYFTAFRRNFKKATLVFLLLLIPGALVLVNTVVLLVGLMETSIAGYIICGLSMLLFSFVWIYVFALLATFENSVFKTLGNALVLSVAHLPTTVAMLLLNLIPVVMLLFFTDFVYRTVIVWIFLVPALIAKADSLLLERVFNRYIPDEDEDEDEAPQS